MIENDAAMIRHALNTVNAVINKYPDVNYDESIEEFLELICSARSYLQEAVDFVEG